MNIHKAKALFNRIANNSANAEYPESDYLEAVETILKHPRIETSHSKNELINVCKYLLDIAKKGANS